MKKKNKLSQRKRLALRNLLRDNPLPELKKKDPDFSWIYKELDISN